MTMRSADARPQEQGRRDLALVAEGPWPAVAPRLPGQDLVLGRDASCDVVLEDPAVSRRHASLVWQDGVWWVQDLGSGNGILIDGARVQQAILTDGARLQIGPFVWTARLRPPPARLPAADGLLVWRLTTDDTRTGVLDRLLWTRQTVIGRSATSDVVVPLDQVSALHARLDSGRRGLRLTDLGSANGVRVNGAAVRTARLHDGDRLEIADLRFRVRRTWIPAPPVIGGASLITALLLVLVLLPLAGRRDLAQDRWWTREMYLEQAQRSLEEAVAAYRRPEPARDLARANFDIALRSLAAVDFLPPGVATRVEIEAALRRAEIEFGGALRDQDLAGILAALEAPPPPVATAPLPPPAAPARPAATPPPFDLNAELALIMAEFGIDTASQPVPPDLVAAIDRQVEFWATEMRGFTRRAWQRGQEHLPLIEAALRRHRLPEVFSYLPFIESGFRVDVTSHAGARGLWQFMPATARRYGLRVDDLVDERTDPVKATEAACQYIEYLLNAFGANSFMSAIAAYNKGEHGLLRCLGRGADWRSRWNFWDIATRGDGCLQQETIDYVPKFFAAAVVLRRPDIFVLEEGGA
jgi:pSer/pThr/pTyr-binding forkhead associated (FHA) protein